VSDPISAACGHLEEISEVPAPGAECPECVAIGSTWFHLRQCLTCGTVGCCDQSPKKHATRHFRAERHPIMRSAEAGESWARCYVDRIYVGGSDL
jgi:uncharacterized UBP type Zn finger protein